MNMTFPSPEFDDAVAAVCHGAADESVARALNVLLRSDARARDEFLLRVELHSRLASEPDLFCQDGSDEKVSLAGTDTRGGVSALPVPARGLSRWAQSRPMIPSRRASQVLALAACFALLAVGGWKLGFGRPAKSAGVASPAVAVLTRVVDARWAGGEEPPRVGSALSPGWLRLESGLAQVVFYSGARVVIEGPAELELISASEAACPRGRLLAEVPQPARGFRLRTERLSVVDIGTAFGIATTPRRTEIHVFDGMVELEPGSAPRQSLAEGEAAVVHGGAPPQVIPIDREAFTSMLEFQQRSVAAEAFRYEQWQFANARMRQDPSLLVHLDFGGLSGTDWTLPNAAGNRSVPEAIVIGCQRAEGRWREKQALEFHSVSDRVRLVVPGEFDALTLSAWVRISGLDRKFNSLFMCEGFEPGTIHWLIRKDGVLGLTLFGEETGQFQITASPPVVTPDRRGLWLHLAVVVDGKDRQAVHYLNGEAVSRHSLRLGPPYRLGASELGNWSTQDGPSQEPKLARNLSGALDEFELFARALTEAEIRQLYDKGNPYL